MLLNREWCKYLSRQGESATQPKILDGDVCGGDGGGDDGGCDGDDDGGSGGGNGGVEEGGE